jgi:hypothetical protein
LVVFSSTKEKWIDGVQKNPGEGEEVTASHEIAGGIVGHQDLPQSAVSDLLLDIVLKKATNA